MTKTELRRVAAILRAEARVMRNSYLTADGEWWGDPTTGYSAEECRADYDELLDLARKLCGEARLTPPAKGRYT